MHAFAAEDIDSADKRRGHRRHKNREASVLQFFNDERWDKGFLNFSERRLPHVLLILPRQSLSQAAKERVARQPFEKRFLDSLPDRAPRGRAHGNADEKTGKQHEEKRKRVFSGEPVRKQHGQWPHETYDRLHCLEQQQNGDVERNDDKQAANKRAHHEFTELFHRRAFEQFSKEISRAEGGKKRIAT